MPDRAPKRFRVGSLLVQVPLFVVVLAWVGRRLGAAASAVLRRLWPVPLLGSAGLLGWAVLQWSPDTVLAVLAPVAAIGVGWRLLHPESFRRLLKWPARGWWKRLRVYRPGWEQAMAACGLSTKLDGVRHLPVLEQVRSTGAVDRLTVRMLAGQVVADYVAVGDRLAQTFGALDARVRSDPDNPNHAILWLLHKDPLTRPVAPLDTCATPDLTALPVALREDGPTYRLRLLGSHLLLVGATGAGKSSVIWSLLHALAPAVASESVKVWVIDPKGGMELAGGRPLFQRFCDGDPGADGDRAAHEPAYADLLDEAVSLMRFRQAMLRGVTRLHEPTPEHPLVVVVVDELASLTAYVTDRDAKKRIASSLSLLLSQGRAVGVLVVAALQDPRKEVLPARDLFPTRIALRLTDSDQVDMVLGDGARDRGARCDRIPETLPGVGYVTLDGLAEPVRVRFAYLTDDHIADLCDRYAPHGPEFESLGQPGRESA